ncbi:MAG: dTDP-4-dehydrorhamnose reductase [Pseudomonadota bacterium]
MSVLVIGRTGQLAREIARRTPDARMLGRNDVDLARPSEAAEALRSQLEGATAVINAAAYTAVDRAEQEEARATIVNGDAPAALARVCAAADVPFVHVSTDYVFDGTGDTARAPDEPVAPLGAYGRSKLVGEEGVRAASGTHAILRTSWLFSAHGGNFVETMLRLSETRDVLTIVADQIGGPTPAAGLADGCLAAARALATDPGHTGTYHWAGAPDVSWADFAREIFAQAGRSVQVTDIPTADYPTPAQRPLNSRLDCRSAEAAFGLSRPDWRAGLADVLKELLGT